MSRRVRLKTREMGDIEVFAIWCGPGGTWERTWEPLRCTPVGELIAVVPKVAWDHALHGWGTPFVKARGLPPEGALHKLELRARACFRRKTCPHYDPAHCRPTSQKMPICFEPEGVGDEALPLVTEILRYWHEGVYVIAVSEDLNGR